MNDFLRHKHSWRLMTAEQDYGKFGPHFGCYTGQTEEICKSCGITRVVRGWQAWKYELEDAEKRVQYLISTEPAREIPTETISQQGSKP